MNCNPVYVKNYVICLLILCLNSLHYMPSWYNFFCSSSKKYYYGKPCKT
jgi:hypothetical protein